MSCLTNYDALTLFCDTFTEFNGHFTDQGDLNTSQNDTIRCVARHHTQHFILEHLQNSNIVIAGSPSELITTCLYRLLHGFTGQDIVVQGKVESATN